MKCWFLAKANHISANLSDEYFRNRQDRYHRFSSSEIASYFLDIHNAVASMSFQVVPEGEGELKSISPDRLGVRLTLTLIQRTGSHCPGPIKHHHHLSTQRPIGRTLILFFDGCLRHRLLPSRARTRPSTPYLN